MYLNLACVSKVQHSCGYENSENWDTGILSLPEASQCIGTKGWAGACAGWRLVMWYYTMESVFFVLSVNYKSFPVALDLS